VKPKRGREPIAANEKPSLRAPVGIDAARLQLDTEYLVLSYPLPALELPESLTPAEREVAMLLVRGLSSAAVAAQRGVALRTISNQIASLYAKVGVSSRIELVRALHEWSASSPRG